MTKKSKPKPASSASDLAGVADLIASKLPKDAVEQLREPERRKSFAQKYWNDPVGFARDCIHWKPGEFLTDYQQEILGSIPTRKRICVRGPHGLGKTTVLSIACLWFSLTRDGQDWKVVTTASAWRQLQKYLWPEIHKWSRRLRWNMIGRRPFNARTELTKLSLQLETGEAFAAASDQPATIEGAHADHMLFVYDEAKAIIDDTFDATEGAFSGAGDGTGREAFALVFSTPGDPVGRFFDIQMRKPGFEDWWARHVTWEEANAAGRITKEWTESRKRQWGENSSLFQRRALGNFSSDDSDGVIPLTWVEKAIERWEEWKDSEQRAKLEAVGVDVADSGEAQTVVALRFGYAIDRLRYYKGHDPMQTAGVVKGILEKHGGQAVVDAIGVGAGVVARLREENQNVLAFVASSRSDAMDENGELGFANTRAAAWWNLRVLLDPDRGYNVCLPPDDDLMIGDLVTPKWRVAGSSGKIQIESKDDIYKRIRRSTDSGDAVVQAFWNLSVGAFETAYGVETPETLKQFEREIAEKENPPTEEQVLNQLLWSGAEKAVVAVERH